MRTAIVTVASLFLAVTATPASAYFDATSQYSYRANDCATAADPISLVLWGSPSAMLYGPAHAWPAPGYLMDKLAGLGPNLVDRGQYFWDHNLCLGDNLEGSDRWWTCRCNRWHYRGNFQWDSVDSPRGGHYYAQMTPHRDIWQPTYRERQSDGTLVTRCKGSPSIIGGNHYVHEDRGHGSGFDRGRRMVVGRFGSRYPVDYSDWGNTRVMKQCNGQLAGSNGTVAFIHVDHG